MKVFQMNDCDWMIGLSLIDCKRAYLRDYCEDTDEARELDEEELDTLIFTDCDENETPSGIKRTFREQVQVEISACGEFPRLFASTEF